MKNMYKPVKNRERGINNYNLFKVLSANKLSRKMKKWLANWRGRYCEIHDVTENVNGDIMSVTIVCYVHKLRGVIPRIENTLTRHELVNIGNGIDGVDIDGDIVRYGIIRHGDEL